MRFSSHSRIFHSFGPVTITDEGLLILVYTQHSWPLSNEGSLACHTYCDTGYLFVVISEDPGHSELAVELSLPVFKSITTKNPTRISLSETNTVQNEPLHCLQWANPLNFFPNFHTYTAHPFYKVIYKQFSRSRKKAHQSPKNLKQIW